MYRVILAVLISLAAVGCREGSNLGEINKGNPVYLTEAHMGKGYIDHINNADRIVISKVESRSPTDFYPEGVSIDFDKEDISKFKDILLNDKSYLFDRKKKCFFVPEYTFEFYLKGYKLLMFYSPLCKELKISYGNLKPQIIGIDPSFEQIENLINRHKKQLEVNNENSTSAND